MPRNAIQYSTVTDAIYRYRLQHSAVLQNFSLYCTALHQSSYGITALLILYYARLVSYGLLYSVTDTVASISAVASTRAEPSSVVGRAHI